MHLNSYDGLLADPEGVLRRTFAWLGFGDAAAAMAAVKPERRTQRAKASAAAPAPSPARDPDPDESELDPAVVDVFDRLYRTVHDGEPLQAALLTALDATQVKLAPRLAEQQRAVARAQQRRRALAQQDATLAPDAVDVGLDGEPPNEAGEAIEGGEGGQPSW